MFRRSGHLSRGQWQDRRKVGHDRQADPSATVGGYAIWWCTIGISAKVIAPEDRKQGEIFREIEPEDLLKYGLIPEFLGRLPVIATLEDLDEASLKLILTQPKNALV